MIVLVGVAGFVLSRFLPYTTFQAVVGADICVATLLLLPIGHDYSWRRAPIRGRTPVSVRWCRDPRLGRARGTRHGQHERRRTPSILISVTVAWSLSWIGLLVNASGFYEHEVGFWSMLVSAGVVIVGTIVVWVSSRHATQETDPAAGPEPPMEVPVG